MDVSEYRRQVEAEVKKAAGKPSGFREVLKKAHPPQEAEGRAFAASTRPADDELATALAVLADPKASEKVFTAALQLISLEIGDHPGLFDSLLEFLGNAANPAGQRIAVLNLLQEIGFRMVGFPAKRPEYLATLRSIIEDPDAQLRRLAIGTLAREKDDYVQRRLVDGLEGRSKPLVPAAKAIQFLAYDVHAEFFPIAKRIVENPPNQGAKVEAVRLLAADPSAKDLLLELLEDRNEKPEVKKAGAIALQSLAPEEFEQQARRIALDNDEDDQLRALSLNALTHFANPAALSEDDELARGVERLNAESTSRHVKQAAAGFIAKRQP